jgi:hypothetical protein
MGLFWRLEENRSFDGKYLPSPSARYIIGANQEFSIDARK